MSDFPPDVQKAAEGFADADERFTLTPSKGEKP